MSKINWNWDPIPRPRRSRSRPTRQSVETIQVIRTTTTEDVDIFAPFKAIAANRRNQVFGRRQRTSQPINWFDGINITVSSEDSIESNGSEGQENINIMTSTPRNTSKALMSSQTPNTSKTLKSLNTSKASNTSKTSNTVNTSKSSKIANTSNPSMATNTSKSSKTANTSKSSNSSKTSKASKSSKSPNISQSSQSSSVFKTSFAQNQTFGRKSYLPEHIERTILDCTPYSSPVTPKTVVKNNFSRYSRIDRTFNKSYRKSINKSITTQTNDSLQNQSLEKGREVDANTEYIDAFDGNTLAINTTERCEATEKITQNLEESDAEYGESIAENPELSAENPESGAEEPELSAENPELSAEDHESGAEDHELSAEDPDSSAEDLESGAEDPELSADLESGAEEPELSAEDLELDVEEPDLVYENDDYSEDNNELNAENPDFGEEICKSSAENVEMIEENQDLIEENPELSEENDKNNGKTDSREVLNENNERNGLRRSKRNRMPRLEYWRGERPVYKRDSTGVTEKIVAINEGSKVDIYRPNKTKGTKRKNGSQEKRTKAINVFDLSIHKKVKINDENKDSLIVKSLESLDWKESGQSPGVYISTVNKNKSKGDALGMLKFAGLAEKKKSKTGDYVTHLTVLYGALKLTIEESSEQIIRTGNYFKVSSDTNYSLSNLRKDIAYLSFTVLKE